jgi:hypothetical protein
MSNNETNALQANFKTSAGSLFNIYGKTPQEFYTNLQSFAQIVGELVSIEQVIFGNASAPAPVAQIPAAVTQAFPAAQVVSVTPIAAPAPSPAGSAPHCVHGPMVFIDGTQKGKTWKGYFCPQPKEATDKCSPIFNKG